MVKITKYKINKIFNYHFLLQHNRRIINYKKLINQLNKQVVQLKNSRNYLKCKLNL